MGAYGVVGLLGARWRTPARLAAADPPPEITPGAFAAWAHAVTDWLTAPVAPGDVCVLPDGRTGQVVEIHEGGDRILVCRAA